VRKLPDSAGGEKRLLALTPAKYTPASAAQLAKRV